MSGSLAITSIRNPTGNLNAAALSSGVSGFGASVGCGICAESIPTESSSATKGRPFMQASQY
jgi:hypothetical protein